MKDHTTAEIFEELWKRMEYDAQVSEQLASESNELQARIDKAIQFIEENRCWWYDQIDADKLYNILKGEEQ